MESICLKILETIENYQYLHPLKPQPNTHTLSFRFLMHFFGRCRLCILMKSQLPRSQWSLKEFSLNHQHNELSIIYSPGSSSCTLTLIHSAESWCWEQITEWRLRSSKRETWSCNLLTSFSEHLIKWVYLKIICCVELPLAPFQFMSSQDKANPC